MKDKVCFKSDSSAQIIILTGFVIAIIILGMGTILYSAANSGQQTSILQSDRAYNNFENIREEYGIALMVSSEKGEINPFNVSNTTTILEFEDRMKTIVESHGFILNFTDHEHIEVKDRAVVNILFADGKKVFNDSVTYNLLTGEIIYDTIPPGYIYDLRAETYTECTGGDGVVELKWTAVGNDYYEDTSAYKYEIRYSNESINTSEEFDNATFYRYYYDVKKNGTEQIYYVEELDHVLWYFAIKVYDKAGNFNFSNNASAKASEWSPEVYNISGNNTPINSNVPELQVNAGTDVIIEFNVTDRDGDNVNISFMIKNESTWDKAWNWTAVSLAEYNNVTFNYTFNDIQENWDFYINVTDDSTCKRSKTSPEGAPDSNYTINLTDYTPPKTIAINSTDYINDTYIDENLSVSNFGLDTSIYIQSKPNPLDKHGLIKFNLSLIPPGATIVSANISLYVEQTENSSVYFHKINSPWDEYGVNWTSFGDSYNLTPSTNGIPTLGYTNWTVTNDVIDFYANSSSNHGWLIKFEVDNMTIFSSKEANVVQRPILYVEYYS